MKTIRRKGGQVFILENGETCPPGEICFLESEYQFAKGLAAGMAHDPESLKSFWETCFEKKLSVPGYLVWMDFPRPEDEEIKLAPLQQSPEQAAKTELARKYAGNILSMLRGKKNVETDPGT